MITILQSTSLALSYLLELALLSAFAFWGYHVATTTLARILLLMGLPFFAALFWGLFLSPKASVKLNPAVRQVLELALFAAGCAALVSAAQPGLGSALGAVYLANLALRLALHL